MKNDKETPSLAAITGKDEIPESFKIIENKEKTCLFFDEDRQTVLLSMKVSERGCFTSELLRDSLDSVESIRSLYNQNPEGLKFFIYHSASPSVFNRGGDLDLFLECIKKGDKDRLKEYGHQCVECVYANYIGFDIPIISISLIQGDALGGGFEAAMSSNFIFSEKRSRFGFPESMFNIFPGMGAVTFLFRRLPHAKAIDMMLNPSIRSAQDLYDAGLVDELLDDYNGLEQTMHMIKKMTPKFNAIYHTMKAKRIMEGDIRKELLQIVDLWADSVFNIPERDIRRIERIISAQKQRSA